MSDFDFKANSDEDPHPTEPKDPGVTLAQVYDESVANAAEARRGNRRTLEVLKNFGSVLDALSVTVNDTHKATRAFPVAKSSGPPDEGALPKEWALAFAELADRIIRIEGSFDRPPAPSSGWWPGSAKAIQPWREAWERQAGALEILGSHVQGLLSRAGLERVSTLGESFDPATMNAVESEIDAKQPDHSVVAEILPGWLHADSGRLIRPAQVRVSRHPAT